MKSNAATNVMEPGDLFRIGNTKPLYKTESSQSGCLDCCGYGRDKLCRRLPLCIRPRENYNLSFTKLSPSAAVRAIRRGDKIHIYK
jgi:hypothetical protein